MRAIKSQQGSKSRMSNGESEPTLLFVAISFVDLRVSIPFLVSPFPLNVGVGLKVHLLRNRAFRGLREAKIEYDCTGTLATVVPVIKLLL